MERGVVIADSAETNDYAPVNQGQVKWLATNAYAELNAILPGGAGQALDALLVGFSPTNNYLPVNVGQLKSVARPFYDRLIEIGFMTGYPWTGGTEDDDDYAPANIGQAKNLFAFDLRGDSNGNGLPDLWELKYFGQRNVKPDDDPDRDGLTNIEEFLLGTDPTNPDTDGDGMTDGIEVARGTDPLAPPQQIVHYVSLDGGHVAPYTNWAMAARDIQSAIDAAEIGELVLVSNGTYAVGGMTWGEGLVSNRVVIYKPIAVLSASILSAKGSDKTVIAGEAGMRCVYIGNGAVLSGITLSKGETLSGRGDIIRDQSGGGAWCEPEGVISNCIVGNNKADRYGGGVYGGKAVASTLENNTAVYGSGAAYGRIEGCAVQDNNKSCRANSWGGGVYECRVEKSRIAGNQADIGGGGSYGGELRNSWLDGNSTFQKLSAGGGCVTGVLWNCVIRDNTGGYAGGAWRCRLYNCTVANNTAGQGTGGAYDCEVYNSIVYYNYIGSKKKAVPADYYGGSFQWSCTKPMMVGEGNITNAPGFADMAAGDYRLELTSPCVDAGINMEWMIPGKKEAHDLDGRERVLNNRVDMGALEHPLGKPEVYIVRCGGDTAVCGVTNVPADYPRFYEWVSNGIPQELKPFTGDSIALTNVVSDTENSVVVGWQKPGTGWQELSRVNWQQRHDIQATMLWKNLPWATPVMEEGLGKAGAMAAVGGPGSLLHIVESTSRRAGGWDRFYLSGSPAAGIDWYLRNGLSVMVNGSVVADGDGAAKACLEVTEQIPTKYGIAEVEVVETVPGGFTPTGLPTDNAYLLKWSPSVTIGAFGASSIYMPVFNPCEVSYPIEIATADTAPDGAVVENVGWLRTDGAGSSDFWVDWAIIDRLSLWLPGNAWAWSRGNYASATKDDTYIVLKDAEEWDEVESVPGTVIGVKILLMPPFYGAQGNEKWVGSFVVETAPADGTVEGTLHVWSDGRDDIPVIEYAAGAFLFDGVEGEGALYATWTVEDIEARDEIKIVGDLKTKVSLLDLEYASLPEASAPPPNEEVPGGFVCLNDDDDDGDAGVIDKNRLETEPELAAADPDLKKVKISMTPVPDVGSVILAVPPELRLWSNEKKNSKIAAGSWNLGTPSEKTAFEALLASGAWVEGMNIGSSELKLDYGTVCGDKVKITVLKVELFRDAAYTQPLDEWEETSTQLRSSKYILGEDDGIYIRVAGLTDATGFSLVTRTKSGPRISPTYNSTDHTLGLTVPAGASYAKANKTVFLDEDDTSSTATEERIKTQHDDLLEVELRKGGDIICTKSVMVDLGEFAAMEGTDTPDAVAWYGKMDAEYPGFVAGDFKDKINMTDAEVTALLNAVDIGFVSGHGSYRRPSGWPADSPGCMATFDSTPGGAPVTFYWCVGPSDVGVWKNDVEWVVLALCSILAIDLPAVSGVEITSDLYRTARAAGEAQEWGKVWAQTLVNASGRPAHGLLGYRDGSKGDPYDSTIAEGFVTRLKAGETVGDAWWKANNAVRLASRETDPQEHFYSPQNAVVLMHTENVADKLKEPTADSKKTNFSYTYIQWKWNTSEIGNVEYWPNAWSALVTTTFTVP